MEKKDSMRFYDATASSYEELYGKEQEAKYDAALKTIGSASLGKALDVGCGPAIFLRRIVPISTLQVGVDVSHRMLVNARKDRPSIHLLCADADFLPLRDGTFDSAFAFTVLQNMPNPTLTLREMLRVIRPEGVIVITLPTSSQLSREAPYWLKEAGIPCLDIEVDASSKDYIYVFRKAGGPL